MGTNHIQELDTSTSFTPPGHRYRDCAEQGESEGGEIGLSKELKFQFRYITSYKSYLTTPQLSLPVLAGLETGDT